MAKRASQLRPLAQFLKKLRIMRNVMIPLLGANERLRRAAMKKFGYKEADMIWLPDKYLTSNL